MTGPSNRGLEALTVVGDSVYAGLQDTGEIFVFRLLPGGAVTYVSTLPPPLGLDDISGLHYDSRTERLFALFDAHNRLLEMSPDGTVRREYVAPGNDQEGFALVGGAASGSTDVFIAEDSQEVWRYAGFPIGNSPETRVPDSRGRGTRLVAFPNPFRSSTSVGADHAETEALAGIVFDARGRRIRSLVRRPRHTGPDGLIWYGLDDQGRRVPAGVYFIRLVTPLGTRCAKVTRLD